MGPFWKQTTFLALLITTALLCNSCALMIMSALPKKPAKLAGTAKESAYPGLACRKVLVVGLSDDATREVLLENGFVDRLAGNGVQVIGSLVAVSKLDTLKDETVLRRRMAEQQIDAVLTVVIKDVPEAATAAPFVWHSDKVNPSWAEACRHWKDSAETDLRSRPRQGSARFEIALWDAASLKRRWQASSYPFDRYDQPKEIYHAADSAAYQLLKEHVLYPAP